MRTIVLSLSGSVVYDSSAFNASYIKELYRLLSGRKEKFVVVVGGGPVAFTNSKISAIIAK